MLNIAAGRGEDFGLVLVRYTLERLLYRLSQSGFRDQFVLKGAMLFQVWTQMPHRPTRDLDLLGRGDSSLDHCKEVFYDLCRISVEDDGLIFSAETVSVERIKEDQAMKASGSNSSRGSTMPGYRFRLMSDSGMQ